MSEETVEKNVVIRFSAKNLVKETADEIQISMRGVAFQFQAAAYSVGELNKLLFANSEAGKQVTAVLHTMGAALRIVNIMNDMVNVLKALHAATLLQTLAEWGHTAALWAKAQALAVVNALSGPLGWAILAGAAVAAAAAIAWIGTQRGAAGAVPTSYGAAVERGRQFGGLITEPGTYYLHAGEFVVPKGMNAGLTFYIDARGSTWTSDYDVDKMMNRVVDRMKRAGVVER